MERQSLVQDVEVSHEGQTYRASYFVEGNTIHAKIGGLILLSPAGAVPAGDTVKALLTGHLLQQTRKAGNASKWANN